MIGSGIGLLLIALNGEVTASQLPERLAIYWTRLDRWMRTSVSLDEDNCMLALPDKHIIFSRGDGYKKALDSGRPRSTSHVTPCSVMR